MNRKARLVVISFVILILLAAACAPAAAPAPAPQSPAAAAPALAPAKALAPIVAAPAKPAWEAELEKITAAAKQEGRLVLYTSFGGEQRQAVTGAFRAKYGIPVESLTGGSSDLGPKIFAEQRAAIYSGDVWVSGSTTHIPLKGALDSLEPALILPELTQPELIKKTWYFGELSWGDQARTMLISLMKVTEPISTNTTLVKAGEISNYRDLLDPKWKGKISLQDPRIGGMGQMWWSVALELGDIDINYVKELITKQDVFVTRDRRLQLDWLARGKNAIAIAPNTATVTEFIGLGAPVNRLSLGNVYISGSTSGIAMMKGAPHANAARLWVNWLLSQEGATVHSRAVGAQSQRFDVPTTFLEPSQVLGPGLKLYRSDNEEFAIKKEGYYTQLAKDVLTPFIK